MNPVNKEFLDTMAMEGCGTPGCLHSTHTFWFHSRCHPGKGVETSYTHGSGVLEMVCRECKRPVARIAVEREGEADMRKSKP